MCDLGSTNKTTSRLYKSDMGYGPQNIGSCNFSVANAVRVCDGNKLHGASHDAIPDTIKIRFRENSEVIKFLLFK